jgi:hypothetical protein
VAVFRAHAEAWEAVRLLSATDALATGIPSMTDDMRSDLESMRIVLLQLAQRAAALADRDMRTWLQLEAQRACATPTVAGGTSAGERSRYYAAPLSHIVPRRNTAIPRRSGVRARRTGQTPNPWEQR